MCVEIYLQRYVARSLLHTYLGSGPGEAVLGGRVQRGDVQRLEAAIWFSDLRGFTQASTSIEPGELVAWLNDYFGAIAKPIADGGGEILKFIGDAILAVFPVTVDRGRQAACEAALGAAEAAHTALDALNVDRVAGYRSSRTESACTSATSNTATPAPTAGSISPSSGGPSTWHPESSRSAASSDAGRWPRPSSRRSPGVSSRWSARSS